MKTLLKKSGYSVHQEGNLLIIDNTNGMIVFFEALLFLVGLSALIFGIGTASWKVALLAIILIGLPFTSNRWRLPTRVLFNKENGRIIINNLTGKQEVDPSNKPGLAVEYYAKSAFVSPFQEGNQDHFYTFQVAVGDERFTLFRLKSRTRIDEDVKGVVDTISQLKAFNG